jgi:hypothetical protein
MAAGKETVSKRFAALEYLGDSKDIKRAWKKLKRVLKPQIKRF